MRLDTLDQSVNTSHMAPTSDLDDIDVLVRNHRPSVLRYALSRLRDRDLAESVTQDCLMRAFRSRSDFRGECSVRTWLITIATNLIRGYTRTKRFHFWKEVDALAVTLSDIHDRVADHRQSPEADLLLKEQLERLWGLVDSLSKRQKQVFLMRYAEEMNLSEIARDTGMTMSAIKTHLYRGVRSIRAGCADQHRLETRKRLSANVGAARVAN